MQNFIQCVTLWHSVKSQSHSIKGETTEEVFQEQTLCFWIFKISYMHAQESTVYKTLKDTQLHNRFHLILWHIHSMFTISWKAEYSRCCWKFGWGNSACNKRVCAFARFNNPIKITPGNRGNSHWVILDKYPCENAISGSAWHTLTCINNVWEI